MVMVRFASTCDKCGRRSAEYTTWATCKECLEDVCPNCAQPNTERDNDGRQTVLCKSCTAEYEVW